MYESLTVSLIGFREIKNCRNVPETKTSNCLLSTLYQKANWRQMGRDLVAWHAVHPSTNPKCLRGTSPVRWEGWDYGKPCKRGTNHNPGLVNSHRERMLTQGGQSVSFFHNMEIGNFMWNIVPSTVRHKNKFTDVIQPTCTTLHLIVQISLTHLTDKYGTNPVPHTLLGTGTNNEEVSVYALIQWRKAHRHNAISTAVSTVTEQVEVTKQWEKAPVSAENSGKSSPWGIFKVSPSRSEPNSKEKVEARLQLREQKCKVRD